MIPLHKLDTQVFFEAGSQFYERVHGEDLVVRVLYAGDGLLRGAEATRNVLLRRPLSLS